MGLLVLFSVGLKSIKMEILALCKRSVINWQKYFCKIIYHDLTKQFDILTRIMIKFLFNSLFIVQGKQLRSCQDGKNHRG